MSTEKKPSPRKEAGSFAANGSLRGVLERSSSLKHEAIDLIVRVVCSYCEPRKRK